MPNDDVGGTGLKGSERRWACARLTPAELDERLEVALTARTCSELAALTADLPDVSGAGASPAPGGGLPEPKDPIRIQCGSAQAERSGLLLVTRPGIVVDADDVTVSSGRVRAPTPWGPDVPEILRIEVCGQVRSGSITARPPRHTFWAWLRRAPALVPR